MMGDRRNPAKEMTMGQMKDAANANGIGNTATTSIPSLKRTLSGGAASSAGHPIGVGPPNLASHLGVGMNSIPSVLHTNPSTGPPQMMRAVTSSGVYNRPGAGGGNNASGSRVGGSVASLSTGNAGGATSVPTIGSRSVTQSSTMQDWRMYLTIEERQAVRSKIRDAYSSRCMSYEDLLQVASAIEEELLHISAPSRLDYFKSGFEFENRVKLKKDQLQGQLAALDSKRRPNTSPPPSSASNAATNSSGDSPNSASESGSSFSKKPRT